MAHTTKTASEGEGGTRAGESFERAAAEVGKRGHDAIDQVADVVHRGASQVKTGIEAASQRLEGSVERVREKAHELSEKKVGDFVDDVRDVVKRHPGKALAAAAAAGFLLAAWLRRKD